MGLKTEYVVQSFVIHKRSVVKPLDLHLHVDRHRAIALAERWAARCAGAVVLEQHVDRENDIFNEPTIIFKMGRLPDGAFEDVPDATDEPEADAAAAAA